MAINYDERQVRDRYQSLIDQYGDIGNWDNNIGGVTPADGATLATSSSFYDGNGNLHPISELRSFINGGKSAYDATQPNLLDNIASTGIGIAPIGGGKFAAGDGSVHDLSDLENYLQTSVANAPNEVQKQAFGNALSAYKNDNAYSSNFSNKEIYESLKKQEESRYSDYLGIDHGTAKSINEILFQYDPSHDYRLGIPYYENDGGRRNISSDPRKQAALDYVFNAGESKRTARRKEFQGTTLAGLLAFAGGAYGLASTPTSGATSGAAAGAAPAAAPAAGGGGFFVGPNGLLGNLGSKLANSAVNSAIQSGLTSAISGGDPLTGVLTGGLTGGLGSQLSGIDFGFGDAVNAALSKAITSAISSGVAGGKPLTAGLASVLGSGVSSALNGGPSFTGADGPGFTLPEGYSADDLEFFNNFQFPSGSEGGGNVSFFDDLFSGDSSSNGLADFFNTTNSSTAGNSFLGDLTNQSSAGGSSSFDFGSLFDNNLIDSSNFNDLLNGFSQADLDFFENAGQSQESRDFLANGTTTPGINSPLSRFGELLVRSLLGGGGGGSGGGLGGLLGALFGGSGGGTGFGDILSRGAGAVLTNSQRQAIEGARDTAIGQADPFASQRGRYQAQLRNLTDNPGSISSSPAFQGIFDLGLEAVNRNASAKGQLNSGNRLQALSDYGQKTASQFYFPQAQLLSGLAGANSGSPSAAADINLRGTERAQGLRDEQAADILQGLTGYSRSGGGILSQAINDLLRGINQ